MNSKKIFTLLSVILIASLALGACATPPSVAEVPTAAPQATDAPVATTAAIAPVELQYWLWDNNQQPAYQACADAFTKQNPNITIKISQQGWGAYWDALTTGFAAGSAPDVFTDHLASMLSF